MPTAATNEKSKICFLAAGDCGPVRAGSTGFPIEHYTELARPVLMKADVRVVNCMRTYSALGEDSQLAPQVRQSPEMSKIFTDCRFDAVTFANNHVYDSGAAAMLDTRDMLVRKGIKVTGAGRNLAEAREPAIVERTSTRARTWSWGMLLTSPKQLKSTRGKSFSTARNKV